MSDSPCVVFLQWALPRLWMRWAGFRKVRRQVCKRVRRRARELGLADLVAYRAYLEEHPEEWALLDSMTRITISRFYRDRGVFGFLEREVLPMLAAETIACGSGTLEVWSAGCASGEEPYTVAMMWQLELARRFPDLSIQILATDLDQGMLTRARDACFTTGSLKELPEHWRAAAFLRQGALHCVRDYYEQAVMVARHDIRTPPPHGPFDLVMCRNLAFTYFDRDLQRARPARGLLTFCDPVGRWSSAAMKRYRRISTASSRGALLTASIGGWATRRLGSATPGSQGHHRRSRTNRRVIRHRRRDDAGSGLVISEMPPCSGVPSPRQRRSWDELVSLTPPVLARLAACHPRQRARSPERLGCPVPIACERGYLDRDLDCGPPPGWIASGRAPARVRSHAPTRSPSSSSGAVAPRRSSGQSPLASSGRWVTPIVGSPSAAPRCSAIPAPRG
jgi:chemotaxis protein methyltransferase CheR